MAGEQGERRGLWNASSPGTATEESWLKRTRGTVPKWWCTAVWGDELAGPHRCPRAHAGAHASWEGESTDSSRPGQVDLLRRREHGEERCKPDPLRGAQNRGEAASYEENN